MLDHDQRFKTLLRTFFVEFLQLFFADWAARLDLDSIEWLDKEVFPDPPEGTRRILDLVARVRTRQEVRLQGPDQPEHWLTLVHVEIESPDTVAPLRPRMYHSYHHLRTLHDTPVLPIALYLKVGLNGVGTDVYDEFFWELHPVHFEYLYVGLPALDGLQYLEGDNLLGVALAALMRIPRDQVAWLGAEALRRIAEAPLPDQRRFLLANCVQAYLPLDEAQRRVYESLTAQEPYEKVRKMNVTVYDQGLLRGIEQGLQKGKEEAVRRIAHIQLQQKFGELSLAVETRLQALPAADVEALCAAILRANSLAELGLE